MKRTRLSAWTWPGLGLMLAFALLWPTSHARAQNEKQKLLHGHVPKVVASLTPKGRVAATNQLRLAVGLPLRNTAELDNFLAQLYDPASPNFRQYLTREEFTARFGPTEQDYESVKDFARTNGLDIAATHGNRLLLDVTGPASAVEQAFHITLQTYQHPTEARDFFAPDTEPMVDAALPVVDVQGLSDFSRPHPKFMKKKMTNAKPKNGSAPDGSGCYFGNDFRNAYVPDTTLTGAGQTVGVLEFDGFYSNDIAAYATAAGNGRTNIVIQTVLLDGYNGVPTTGANSGDTEVSLDIELAMAIAPGLAKIISFEAGPKGLQNDVLNAMLTDSNMVKNLSCSWGWDGGPSATTDTIFTNMAAVGQSFFNASGDSDAFTTGATSANGVDNTSQFNAPSSSPIITQVGGTALAMYGTGTSYAAETVWNWGFISSTVGYVGSSGGISSYYSIPSWQTTVTNLTGRGGSTTQRNIPDVALTADDVFVSDSNGANDDDIGGTSCAAPLWAGFMALVNQQAAAHGKPGAGFINPAIYAIAAGPAYAACFHDITTGNNTWSGSPGLFYATNGYDLCTGLGTPAGQNLINALAGSPDSLVVSPISGASTGQVGGPFSVTSGNFLLTNSSVSPLTWSLVSTSAWLTISPTSGTLVPAAHTNLTYSLTAAAGNLAAGIYTNNLIFSNGTSHVSQTGLFTLNVGQTMVLNGDFEITDFSFWNLNGGINNFVDNGSATGLTPHSGNWFAALGQKSSLGYLSQTLPTAPNQPYLLSLWLESGGSRTPIQFQVSWNATTLFNQSNFGKFGWTNLEYLVVATGNSTTLQFGFRDDRSYLGLDDVTVTPVPLPKFTAVTKTNTSVYFTWTTMAGLSYQLQYNTNLLLTNWTNVGSPIPATSGTLTATDPSATGPQRFYRLQLLP